MSAPVRLNACLVSRAGRDSFVSIRAPAPDTLDFLAVTYRRTAERTHGGWLVYRET